MKLRQYLIRFHFGGLLFLIAHTFLQGATGYGLNGWILFAFKLAVYGAGTVLYFLSRKPFRKWRWYFGIYFWSPLVVLVGWMMDGIFGAILGSFFFLFLIPPSYVFKDGNYLLNERFGGFMGRCCTYDIIEHKYFLLQRHRGEVTIGGEHSFQNSTFTAAGNQGYLRLEMEVYDLNNHRSRKVDTTLVLLLH